MGLYLSNLFRHHVERVSPLGRCIPCIDSLHCRASEEDGQAKMCLICRAAKKNVKIRLIAGQLKSNSSKQKLTATSPADEPLFRL